MKMLEHKKTSVRDRAFLTVEGAHRAPWKISPWLFGKFTEHLGANVYYGIEAQILRNPTFGAWQFWGGESVDGGVLPQPDRERIAGQIREAARRAGADSEALLDAFQNGVAFWWFRIGKKEDVRFSPDVAPQGSRAQRIEILKSSGGVAQQIHLPLHRTRGYRYRVVARAAAPVPITLCLGSARAQLALKTGWKTFTGRFDGVFKSPCSLIIRASAPANFVVARALLYPDDAVGGCDPDVIRFFREARLPLMRWPGGNFVSGYHWRDGVGPVDLRPTRPNPAWDGLEYNLFGTDEFIALCRAIGCEPMICVNAGDGTPEEAAAWVSYCRRKRHGVKLWEIGNEIYGKWQVRWTTAGGNVDRYRRFRDAMLKADPTIQVFACGAQGDLLGEWNQRLIAEAKPQRITDHILNYCRVNAETNPVELIHAYLGEAVEKARVYRKLRRVMLAAGIQNPRLAITEQQLFPHFTGTKVDFSWSSQNKRESKTLTPETMPTPATISEALYFATVLLESVRLGGFVELITHSATVNHGGGLRKTHERVWANPVHYAHALGAALFDATPVAVQLTCGTCSTRTRFGSTPPLTDFPVLDALAAISADHKSLVLLLVHRCATSGPIAVSLDLRGFRAGSSAEVMTLAGKSWHDQNTASEPERIRPRCSTLRLADGKAKLLLPPLSLTRVVIPRAK